MANDAYLNRLDWLIDRSILLLGYGPKRENLTWEVSKIGSNLTGEIVFASCDLGERPAWRIEIVFTQVFGFGLVFSLPFSAHLQSDKSYNKRSRNFLLKIDVLKKGGVWRGNPPLLHAKWFSNQCHIRKGHDFKLCKHAKWIILMSRPCGLKFKLPSV